MQKLDQPLDAKFFYSNQFHPNDPISGIKINSYHYAGFILRNCLRDLCSAESDVGSKDGGVDLNRWRIGAFDYESFNVPHKNR